MARHPATSRADRTGAETTSGRPEGRPPVVFGALPRPRSYLPSAAPVPCAATAVADGVAAETGDRELRGVRGTREVRVHHEEAVARPGDRRRPGEARVARLALEARLRVAPPQLERLHGAVGVVRGRAAHDEQTAAVDQEAVTTVDVAVAALDRDLLDAGRRRGLGRPGVIAIAAVVVAVAVAERDAEELADVRLHDDQLVAAADDDAVEVERVRVARDGG